MLRLILIIVGVIVAAVGGVLAYRALFIEPYAAVIITNTDIHEVKNWWKVTGGIIMLIAGAAIAFIAATRRR